MAPELSMDNAAVSHDTDLVHATFVLAMLVFVVSVAAVVVVRRWRGVDDVDRAGWRPQQVKADRRWRLFLGLLLIASWTCMAVAVTDRALEPGIATSLRAAIGPVPIPKWLAVVIHPRFDYHGPFWLLWANGVWLGAMLEKRDGTPRLFKLVGAGGFVCFLAFCSIFANIANICG
jgi:hypothetical protein